jgi:hypothetical protein
LQQSLSRFKDTSLFLSPVTQKFHDNRKGNQVVRSCLQLMEIEGGAKEIIESINHILNLNLDCKNPAAANFVGMVVRNMH